jgi:hypothetical protein
VKSLEIKAEARSREAWRLVGWKAKTSIGHGYAQMLTDV